MWHNFLVADHFQHVTHSLRQLAKGHHVFVISQMQVKSNAFRHVICEPPSGITSFISRPRDRRIEPIAIELEKLSRVGTEIWKFFLNRDHDSYSFGCSVMPLWKSGQCQAGTIP